MAVTVLRQFKIQSIIKGLTACIGVLSFSALSSHINLEYSLLFLFLFAASFYCELKGISISRWILTTFSIAVIAFFLLILNRDDFVPQMLEALLILLGIKFLELKQVRDYVQIYAISLFLLSGIGLFALGTIFVVYLLIFVFFLSISSIFLAYYAQDPSLEVTQQTAKKMVLKCLWIPVLAIPLSVLMFIILPRTQYPLLDFLNRPSEAKTGFTDRVRLGEVSGIQEDTSIIFRANMEKIAEMDLYWRGITLDYFDGTSWKTTEKKPFVEPSSHPRPTGRIVRQIIYLEPYQNSYLFGLDKPLFVSQRRVKKLDDITFIAPISIERRIRYEVTSAISDTIYEEYIDEKKYLHMPRTLSPKIIELAHRLTAMKTREEAIQNLFLYLNAGQYRYSLEGLPLSKNPLEVFLFESKYGNCEYFASAFAIMLRISGIPSRIVGGYRGGYYNDMGKYYLIPQKNAHVWVEAFVPQKGWVRMDPTPVSAATFALPLKGNIFLKMNIFFDTINYYWYSIVINYNLEKQITIAHTLITGIKRPSLHLSIQRRQLLTPLVIIMMTASTVFTARSFFVSKKTPEKKILFRFLKKMEKYGYRKTDSQGLEEFVSSIHDEKLKTCASRFVAQLETTYYHDKKLEKQEINILKKLIQQIPLET